MRRDPRILLSIAWSSLALKSMLAAQLMITWQFSMRSAKISGANPSPSFCRSPLLYKKKTTLAVTCSEWTSQTFRDEWRGVDRSRHCRSPPFWSEPTCLCRPWIEWAPRLCRRSSVRRGSSPISLFLRSQSCQLWARPSPNTFMLLA